MLRTWSGKFAPLKPGEGEVCILDVVVVGGRAGRFGNNGDPEWTVLHHGKLVSLIALRLGYGPIVAAYALIHDDHEAVFGFDPSKPWKNRLAEVAKELGATADPLKQIEAEVDARLYEHLHLDPPDDDVKRKVKECDSIAGVIESLLFGPVDCDLAEVLPEEDRPRMLALCEQVVPGFQAMVRKRL